MPSNNIEIFKKIKPIIEIRQVFPVLEIKEKVSQEIWENVLANEKLVNVYRILYKSAGNKVVGFIVEPKEIKEKLPCIIYNRGGSRDFSELKLGRVFSRLGNFAKRGYIVFASNYSGSTGSEGLDDWGGDNLANVLDFYKIIQKYEWADEKRIGMYGWSRGAMMTYLCLAKVKWIKAAVAGAGPADEVNAPRFRKGWREHQISLYGKNRKEQVKRSALYWPEKITKKTPLLLMHGTADWRVNPMDTLRLSQELFKNKVPFRMVIFEGGNHGVLEFESEKYQMAYDWFYRFLKKGEKLPNLKPHGE